MSPSALGLYLTTCSVQSASGRRGFMLNGRHMVSQERKLRVCMVAPFPPRKGGVTVQTALLTRYLEQSGIEVLKADTNLQSLRRRGLGPIRLALQPWVVLFRMLGSISKCDVVHFLAASYWGFTPTALGVPLCRMLGKHSVVSYLGGQGPQFIDRFPWLTKPIFRRATVITVCSNELKDEFERRGVACELVNNIFESELYTPSIRNSVKRKLAWTRAFEETYDPMGAIKAFEIVKSRFPDASLVMTSNGSLMAQVQNYIRERQIQDVSLPGRVPKEDVADFMRRADICINTSQLDGLPTALLEAAGTGLPIITTPVGGIPTAFTDGVSAMMVPVGDPEALANAIIDLIENPDRADRIGSAGREVALCHTWERLKETWMRIYGFCGGGN